MLQFWLSFFIVISTYCSNNDINYFDNQSNTQQINNVFVTYDERLLNHPVCEFCKLLPEPCALCKLREEFYRITRDNNRKTHNDMREAKRCIDETKHDINETKYYINILFDYISNLISKNENLINENKGLLQRIEILEHEKSLQSQQFNLLAEIVGNCIAKIGQITEENTKKKKNQQNIETSRRVLQENTAKKRKLDDNSVSMRTIKKKKK